MAAPRSISSLATAPVDIAQLRAHTLDVVTDVTTNGGYLVVETGVRELKIRASEIIRAVRERRVRYVITHRGKAVAILAPLDPVPAEDVTPLPDAGGAVWDELVRLGARIGKGWRARESSVQLLSRMRR